MIFLRVTMKYHSNNDVLNLNVQIRQFVYNFLIGQPFIKSVHQNDNNIVLR